MVQSQAQNSPTAWRASAVTSQPISTPPQRGSELPQRRDQAPRHESLLQPTRIRCLLSRLATSLPHCMRIAGEIVRPRIPWQQDLPAQQAMRGLRPADDLAPSLGQDLERGEVLLRRLPAREGCAWLSCAIWSSCWATSSTWTLPRSMASMPHTTRCGWLRWPRNQRMCGRANRARCLTDRVGRSPRMRACRFERSSSVR